MKKIVIATLAAMALMGTFGILHASAADITANKEAAAETPSSTGRDYRIALMNAEMGYTPRVQQEIAQQKAAEDAAQKSADNTVKNADDNGTRDNDNFQGMNRPRPFDMGNEGFRPKKFRNQSEKPEGEVPCRRLDKRNPNRADADFRENEERHFEDRDERFEKHNDRDEKSKSDFRNDNSHHFERDEEHRDGRERPDFGKGPGPYDKGFDRNRNNRPENFPAHDGMAPVRGPGMMPGNPSERGQRNRPEMRPGEGPYERDGSHKKFHKDGNHHRHYEEHHERYDDDDND